MSEPAFHSPEQVGPREAARPFSVDSYATAPASFSKATVEIEAAFRRAVDEEIAAAKRAGVHIATLDTPFPPGPVTAATIPKADDAA
jgi:hypothetical protein